MSRPFSSSSLRAISSSIFAIVCFICSSSRRVASCSARELASNPSMTLVTSVCASSCLFIMVTVVCRCRSSDFALSSCIFSTTEPWFLIRVSRVFAQVSRLLKRSDCLMDSTSKSRLLALAFSVNLTQSLLQAHQNMELHLVPKSLQPCLHLLYTLLPEYCLQCLSYTLDLAPFPLHLQGLQSA